VDSDEIDRLAGRVRPNRDKFSKYSADKLGITRTGPSVAELTASLAKRGSVSDSTTDTSRRQSTDTATTPQLPKQSGFVPRNRKSTTVNDDNEAMPEIPNLLRQKSVIQRSNSTPNNEVVIVIIIIIIIICSS